MSLTNKEKQILSLVRKAKKYPKLKAKVREIKKSINLANWLAQ